MLALFKRLVPLYLVIFIGFLGYSMTLPLFTTAAYDTSYPLLPAHWDADKRSLCLGFLLFTYPAGQFFGSPFLGTLSDHWGRRRVLLCSLSITCLLYLLIVVALALPSLPLLFVTLFLAGLSEGNITIAQGAIADCSHGPQRTIALGHIYSAASMAYICGPLIAGALANRSWLPLGYANPFLGVFFLLIGALLWLYLAMPSSPPTEEGKIRLAEALTNVRTLVTHRTLRPFFLMAFAIYLGIFGYFAGFPMFAVDRFGLDTTHLSYFIAYIALSILVTNSLLVPLLSKTTSMSALAGFSAILTGLCMWLIPLPPHSTAFWLTLLPTSVAVALCQTGATSAISHNAGRREQGKVMGANQALLAASEALSALVAGALAARQPGLPLVAFGALAAGGGLALLILRLKR